MIGELDWFNRRERQLLVHSFLYYQLNINVISDHTFDTWSKELAARIVKEPDIFKQSIYYTDFQGFDGSTGAFLPYTNPEIQDAGYRLLNAVKYNQEKKEVK